MGFCVHRLLLMNPYAQLSCGPLLEQNHPAPPAPPHVSLIFFLQSFGSIGSVSLCDVPSVIYPVDQPDVGAFLMCAKRDFQQA